MQYNLQFKKLCEVLNLGEMTELPEPLVGGLLNKMYKLNTKKGKYAVKALNPQIMLRKTALQNRLNSEYIAQEASKFIPSLPALQFDGEFLFEMDGQYYMVFDWIEGITIKENIKEVHCLKVSEILAKLHSVDFSKLDLKDLSDEKVHEVNWKMYSELCKDFKGDWKNCFKSNFDHLIKWNKEAKIADLMLTEKVISHRDIDPKNVMWLENNPTIIDWEAAGLMNPYRELIDMAMYWSKDTNGNINKDKFQLIVRTYQNHRGVSETKWLHVLHSVYAGLIGWLEYNLKRALLLECTDEEEQRLGEREVISTLKLLNDYSQEVPKLLKWLEELKNKL